MKTKIVIAKIQKPSTFSGGMARVLNASDFTKLTLDSLGISLIDFTNPLKLVADASQIKEHSQALADYIRKQANAGVNLTAYNSSITVAAKLNFLIKSLATPTEDDSLEYKNIYKAMHRIYLDHALAHRFGVGGDAEFSDLSYELDGCYSYTMIEELQSGFIAFKALGKIKLLESLNTFFAELALEVAEREEVVETLYSDVGNLLLAGWDEKGFNDKFATGPIGLPTALLLGHGEHIGGHANGCVLFKNKEKQFLVLADRGGDVELVDCGITVNTIRDKDSVSSFVKRVMESNSNPMTGAEFDRQKESLHLERLSLIEKKPHKAGTCGFSSSAKLVAQGMQYARFYILAVNKHMDEAVAHDFAARASTVVAKAFSIFDRRNILSHYLAECTRLDVETNKELLAEIKVRCGDKHKYAEIVACIDGQGVELDVESARERFKQKMKMQFVDSVAARVTSIPVDRLESVVDEMFALYMKSYTREEVLALFTRFKEMANAMEVSMHAHKVANGIVDEIITDVVTRVASDRVASDIVASDIVASRVEDDEECKGSEGAAPLAVKPSL
ncbi:MAG: hypothetical protein HON32_06070 [Francisellaceae bacterium]|nr:hypothetical protein [Francisellaceae bacterium]